MEEEEAMDVDYESDSDDNDDTSSGFINILSGSDFHGSRSTLFSDEDEEGWSTNDDTDEINSSDMGSTGEEEGDDDQEEEQQDGFEEGEATVPEGTISNNVESVVVSNVSQTGHSNANAEAAPPPSPDAIFLPSQSETVNPSVAVIVQVETASDATKKTPITHKHASNVCSQSPGNDDEGQNCPICFEPWTSSGSHRLISLKCGHLFGLTCIEKWLKGSKAKCPQCNALAKKSEIRNLYVRSLKALDTCERDRALQDLEKEKELRRRAELDAANMRMKYQMSIQECEKLKKELIDYQGRLQKLRNSRKRDSSVLDDLVSSKAQSPMYVLEKTLDISKDGCCRVLGASSFFPMLVITQESTNKGLFPGYGIKKISTLDMRPAEFLYLHKEPIRDLAFHSYDSLILTTALDKTVKITNVYSNSVVQCYNLPMDAWSCCWSKDDSSCFYAGLKNGTVLEFDTRKTDKHLQQLPYTGHRSPVVGLQYMQKKASFDVSGLAALQLWSGCFFEKKSPENYKVHPLPIEGNFTSLCLEPSTGHFLVSCRPSVKHSKVTHMLCELSCTNSSDHPTEMAGTCNFNVVQTLHGGSTQVKLTKSKVFPNPANECSVLVCAGDDNAQAALIWDVNSGQCLQQLKADGSVLDVCNFRINEDHFLSTLTDRTLRVYRWKKDEV